MSSILTLTERERSSPVHLTLAQQRALKDHFRSQLEPAEGGLTIVTPGDRVGAAHIDGLNVTVQPKVPVQQVLKMVAEASDPYDWLKLEVEGLESLELTDGLAALFVQVCQRTFERGLYRSYRRTPQELQFVRGRIRMQDLMTRFAPIPVPVEADVYDDDTLENQVLRAALRVVRTGPGISSATRIAAHRAWRQVEHVSEVVDPAFAAERIAWTRHNAWYESAVALARLVLQGSSLDLSTGSRAVAGFVLNMPTVVEQWIRTRLRKSWGLPESVFPDNWAGKLWLDTDRRIELKPDLGVRVDKSWVFVGDVKYKSLEHKGARREDIYQSLAYLSATGLREATLIYAGVDALDTSYTIAHDGSMIHVVALDLAAPNARERLDRLSFAPAVI